ncbi:response regulator transcription factor [Actinoplanes sp. L3-i22]|uniref:response regulator transcription factor n=1 Tax=Actinoplanes sp. L3-i22 TaxID=2836373 RepID=UPI001C750917|nr:response regulator transcription factor [Actinoplanes sp. L3-i22]BCY10943.1 DNA-binding response regulator [Actinoplanes sp. L3-i22]
MRVLLVEDDHRIAGPLAEGLGRYGFAVEHVGTGAEALAAGPADLVLLDLGLPDIDGIDVCRELRAVSAVPVIMLTARDAESDRVVGLELGADDYLAKPFSLRELIARIRAVLRRAHAEPVPFVAAVAYLAVAVPAPAAVAEVPPQVGVQELGPLALDRRARQVRVAGQPVAFAPKEFDLLALLAEDPGAVYSRQQILDSVWDPHYFGPTKTLDVHVAAVRRKLGDPEAIETIRRVGFRLAWTGEKVAR